MFESFSQGTYTGLKITTRLGKEIFFTGKSADFSVANFSLEMPNFQPTFNVASLIVLNQVHQDRIVLLDPANYQHELLESKPEGTFTADGFQILNNSPAASVINLCFGIRTADCLPICLETDKRLFLLHAGWRGVAKGIIENAIDILEADEVVRSFIIGPAACSGCYEVGAEVLKEFDHIVPLAEAMPGKDSKYLLDLKGTAVKVFEQSLVRKSSDCLEAVSKICTIQDVNWHSHRREGALRGSNLMFVKMSF